MEGCGRKVNHSVPVVSTGRPIAICCHLSVRNYRYAINLICLTAPLVAASGGRLDAMGNRGVGDSVAIAPGSPSPQTVTAF